MTKTTGAQKIKLADPEATIFIALFSLVKSAWRKSTEKDSKGRYSRKCWTSSE